VRNISESLDMTKSTLSHVQYADTYAAFPHAGLTTRCRKKSL